MPRIAASPAHLILAAACGALVGLAASAWSQETDERAANGLWALSTVAAEIVALAVSDAAVPRRPDLRLR